MNTLAAATVRDSPLSARAQYNRGIACARQNDFANAIPAFQRALDLYPKLPLARVKLARCYRDTGDYRAAEENLRLVLRDNPGNPEAREILADVCSRLKDTVCLEALGLGGSARKP
jgi:tetratricopeptide (TPR) repeat protein